MGDGDTGEKRPTVAPRPAVAGVFVVPPSPVSFGFVLFTAWMAAFAFAAEIAVAALGDGRLQKLAHGDGGDTRASSVRPPASDGQRGRASVREPAVADGDGDPRFVRLSHERERILARWLVVRVVCIAFSTASLVAAARGLTGLYADVLVPVAASVLTYGLFAEMLGTIARKRPERFARIALVLLRPLEIAAIPLAAPLALVGSLVGARLRDEALVTETDVEWAISQGEKAGTIEEEPATMLRNVLEFKDVIVRDVMVPRRKVAAVAVGTPLLEVLELVAGDGHSRYPVFEGSLDNVIGILYVKDLFARVNDRGIDGIVERPRRKADGDLVRGTVLRAAKSQSAHSVLREMRQKRQHLAIVMDEYGGTDGLVTLEDIIEEIVGEIDDEYDDESPIVRLDADRVLADATIPLGDLESYLGARLPLPEDIESLGGLLTHEIGRVPDVGEIVTLGGYDFVVREADETRVVNVEIVRRQQTAIPPPVTG